MNAALFANLLAMLFSGYVLELNDHIHRGALRAVFQGFKVF